MHLNGSSSLLVFYLTSHVNLHWKQPLNRLIYGLSLRPNNRCRNIPNWLQTRSDPLLAPPSLNCSLKPIDLHSRYNPSFVPPTNCPRLYQSWNGPAPIILPHKRTCRNNRIIERPAKSLLSRFIAIQHLFHTDTPLLCWTEQQHGTDSRLMIVMTVPDKNCSGNSCT